MFRSPAALREPRSRRLFLYECLIWKRDYSWARAPKDLPATFWEEVRRLHEMGDVAFDALCGAEVKRQSAARAAAATAATATTAAMAAALRQQGESELWPGAGSTSACSDPGEGSVTDPQETTGLSGWDNLADSDLSDSCEPTVCAAPDTEDTRGGQGTPVPALRSSQPYETAEESSCKRIEAEFRRRDPSDSGDLSDSDRADPWGLDVCARLGRVGPHESAAVSRTQESHPTAGVGAQQVIQPGAPLSTRPAAPLAAQSAAQSAAQPVRNQPDQSTKESLSSGIQPVNLPNSRGGSSYSPQFTQWKRPQPSAPPVVTVGLRGVSRRATSRS